MIDRWSQVIALANSFSFVGASGCCRNLSTQIGASASTTAVCARSLAIRSAVSWSLHPKIEKPSTHTMAAPITAPQIPGLRLGGNVTDLMNHTLPAPQWGIDERSELPARQAIRATTYAIACGEERLFCFDGNLHRKTENMFAGKSPESRACARMRKACFSCKAKPRETAISWTKVAFSGTPPLYLAQAEPPLI